jgi:F-type H+-transporting ATPase subunit alpha
LAQYRELKAFAQFGSDLDKATLRQLYRGERLVELLKQEQFAPLPVEKQVAVIYAGTKGHLDAFPPSLARTYEQDLLAFLDNSKPSLLRDLAQKKELTPEINQALEGALKEFEARFRAAHQAAAA